MIELVEYGSVDVPVARLSEDAVVRLQSRYNRQLTVQLQMVGSRYWRLTAHGWVGSIPLDDVVVLIRPKIPLPNLFKLIEIAWDFNFKPLDGVISSNSISGFFNRLAGWLAQQVLLRSGRGLHRAYVGHEESLPYVRGRLHTHRLAKMVGQGSTQVPVRFEEISADIPHNQVLLAALDIVLRNPMLSGDVLKQVQKAHRLLRSAVSRVSFTDDEIGALHYDRLNADYRSMHTLCRFLMTNSAPLHEPGEQEMLPFLIDMAQLFEKFVARWLSLHLPDTLRLSTQERSTLAEGQINIAIDLVLLDNVTNAVLCVLDTKWKSAEKPSNDDIYQISFYANSRNSPSAALIYPSSLRNPLSTTIRDIALETLVFDVSAEIDAAGKQFMIQLKELTAKSQRRQ